MPFISQLQHWAAARPQQAAVIVGEQALSYAALLHEAGLAPAGGHVSIIDEPTGTGLAAKFCAAVLQGRTAMVLDAGWPAALRRDLAAAAAAWENGSSTNGTFLLGLSSGTSGTPKAFIRSAESWRESFIQSTRHFGVEAGCTTLAPGPLAASMNLYALGESIHAGGTFVALPHFTPDAALDAMGRHGATRLVLVPTVLELMAARGLATGQGGAVLRQIVCAGSALGPETLGLARRWAPQAHIQQYYGAAELGFVAASSDAAAPGVGMAFPGVKLSIRGPGGAELPAGTPGNICVRSPYICGGYAWGDDGLAFGSVGGTGTDPAAWFTVNDQGWLDADGVLHVAGRAGDMVVTAGANVYPHEVESALAAAVQCGIMVAGVPDSRRGQLLAAGIVVRGAMEVDAVLAGCRKAAQALPAGHRPTAWYALDTLPLTGSGKPSRRLFAQWIQEGDPRARRIR